MRLAVFLTLPSAVGLWFMAGPVIGLVYQHGNFTNHDTLQTALALQYYAIGLVAYSCIKVLSPAFYAINRKWTPMLVSFGSVALNIALNNYFMFRLGMGHTGLALSTTICATLNFAALYLLMRPAARTLDSSQFFSTLARCALATIPIALICLAGNSYLPGLIPSDSLAWRAASVLATISAAVASYLLACLLLRVDETQSLLEILKRKLQKTRTP
jgi:putative peptidoglycan lipid II flippase